MAQPATQALGIQPPPTTTLPTIQVTAPARAQPPAFQMPTSSAGALDLIGNTMAQERAQIAPVVSGMQTQMKADQARVNQAEQAVQPFNPPPAPTPPPELTAAQKFGSLSSIFAIAASAFTRTPMINAMNAMAAGIKARQQNDAAGYAQAYQAWKTNTDIALERHQAQQSDLDDALKMLSTNIQKGTAMIQAYSAEYGDTFMAAQLALGHFDKMAELATTRADTAARLQESYLALQMHQEDANKAQPFLLNGTTPVEYRPLDGKWYDQDGHVLSSISGTLTKPGAAGASAAELTPAALAANWAAFQTTGKFVISGFGATAANAATLNWGMTQPGTTPQSVAQAMAAAKANGLDLDKMVSTATYADAYMTSTVENMNKAVALMPKGFSGDISPILKTIAQNGLNAMGDPNIKPYEAQIVASFYDYAKVINGGTGSVAQLNQGAAEEASKLLNAGMNEYTVKNVLNVMYSDMEYKNSTYQDSIQGIVGAMRAAQPYTGVPVPALNLQGNEEGSPPPVGVPSIEPLPPQAKTAPDGTVFYATIGGATYRYQKQGGVAEYLGPANGG